MRTGLNIAHDIVEPATTPVVQPSASYSITMRVRLPQRPGSFGRVASAIGGTGELDIPVFHDDQHGTAIVTLAALVNALRVVGKRVQDVKVLVSGAGAAGVACTDILLAQGVSNVVVCDRGGAIYRGRPDLVLERAALADRTNPHDERGTADHVLAGADVFLGLSGPRAISVAAVRTMAPRPVVFAMANPVPEVQPEEVRGDAAIIATGRSDYPNQINNVLAFPGVLRGALDVRATTINEDMMLAAAQAIAAAVGEHELHAEYLVPSPFNRDAAPAVAHAVARAAEASGVARRSRVGEPFPPSIRP
jgi:malate dehydrogenase (oxaloacetate-decarboxylating)